MDSAVHPYEYPSEQRRSDLYRVTVGGQPVEVLATNVADFASAAFRGPVEVCVRADEPAESVLVRPLKEQINTELSDGVIRFSLTEPRRLWVDLPGRKPLFLFFDSIEDTKPNPDDPQVRFFPAGAVHDVGELHLQSGQTLYIEAGAVVRGCVRALRATGIRILGRGILTDEGHVGRRRMVLFEDCEDVLVDGPTFIEPTSWMLVFGNCRNVTVRNLKEVGEVVSSDGIDVVGSRDVLIEDCFLRNNDDCVVVKAVNFATRPGLANVDWDGEVDNIFVQRCQLWNDRAGNALEVGFETATDVIQNITFRDCDVLRVNGHGAAFSIHNGDRALIRNVLFEDIRVEHYYDKLFDFRIVNARYATDQVRGQVRDVTLRNILVHQSPVNLGYSTAIVGGYTPAHRIENVVLDGIYLNERPASTAEDLDLYVRNADVRFV